jgi:hypothetical protein
VIRFLVRTAIVLVGNAVGLIVASLVFDDFEIDITGFILSLIIFTVVAALMTPFLESTFRRGRSTSAAVGGVALISTFVALVVTDVFSDGLSISGVGTWIGATVVVWLGSLIAVFVLPFLGLRKYLEERRA